MNGVIGEGGGGISKIYQLYTNKLYTLKGADEWLDITQGEIQKHLQHLDLSGLKCITDLHIESLHHLHKLTNLSLSGCDQFAGV